MTIDISPEADENLWRFWANKAQALAEENKALSTGSGAQQTPSVGQIAAWAGYSGIYAACINAARVRNELDALVLEFRGGKDYKLSDQLRALADALEYHISYPYPQLARRSYQQKLTTSQSHAIETARAATREG